jgi:hypothetical protein
MESIMPDGEHPAMDPVETAGADALADRPSAEPDLAQLSERYDPVLACRQRGDFDIHSANP